ncbi:TIGR03943 family protein [Caproiciproducens sp. NJN-50]|uniref:TIGR03943 family putative permease subunit n=1 Tax=Acutalibacteraceae TaxID=3082771 RepID=UPI000FFE031F|nr:MULTISPECIES: TIGR03943 family protein [Acutalibacteraceae]QAT50529.1 TIGR03943 family protein [Caproiciproducens sp. NJN-50]
MRRKINPEVLLEALICLSLSVLLLYALISGRASEYVHPRINGYLWFSSCALFVISLLLLSGSLRPRHNARPARFLLFLIPIFSVLLIPAGAVQSRAVSFGSTAAAQSAAPPSGKSAAASSQAVSTTGPSSSALPQEDASGVTSISDEQFAAWYQDINKDMEKYEGKTLRFKGQVFRMDGFAKNEIVPVRYAMVCCTADLQPCGILCRSGEASQYKDNDWVWVTGKVKIETYMDQTMPVCYVTKIEKAEKAKAAYIYFTY